MIRSLNLPVLLVLFCLLIAFSGCQSSTIQKPEKPNIVFILADDLGWADLPMYGNQFNEAPNIEHMADQGITFTNAYAASPVCSSTRASIQSGQYTPRVGIIDFLPGHWRPYEKLTPPTNRTQYMPLYVTTVGEALQEVGYTTGYYGKWHLGRTRKYHPANQGYDDATVFQGGPYYNFGNRLRPKQEIKEGVRLSEKLTDMGIDFMKKNKNSPFFLTISHYDVHVQLDADSTLIEKYLNKEEAEGYPSNAVYAAMIEHIDRSIARVNEALSELGLGENTMVVFFSDNGGLVSRFDKKPLIAPSKRHYYQNDTLKYVATSNDPLRGEKGTVYEGGIREPMIVKWPGQIEGAQKSDALISSVDLFPTFMELAGADLPQDQVIDGQSFLPQLMGNQQGPNRTLYWHYPVYHHEVPMGAIRKGDWKLVENFQTGEIELFNLENDIGESRNLADQKSQKRDELLEQLKQWREGIGARLPEPNPDFDSQKRITWQRHPEFQQMANPQ